MNCIICGLDDWEVITATAIPDKYESHMGIHSINRSWEKCSCGHYQQRRSYPLSWLEEIYKYEYRSEGFRGKSIDKVFRALMSKSPESSENFQRVEWISTHLPKEVRKVLDIGSGIGVFPFEMRLAGYDVYCSEINCLSKEFAQNKLMLPCYDNWGELNVDCVTLIHVLEHIDKPDEFLKGVKRVCDHLVVEVPDSKIFDRQNWEHDDFNSCHIHMFNLKNLTKLVNDCGFDITESKHIHYQERNLDRILTICSKKAN